MPTKLFSYARKTLSELIVSKTIRRQNVQLFRDICQAWFEFVSFQVLRSIACIPRLQHGKNHNRLNFLWQQRSLMGEKKGK